LRGSGRFGTPRRALGARLGGSQSPSLRGSGRFVGGGGPPGQRGVSIPFIAGQWSLPTDRRAPAQYYDMVSIPFIAGQWSLPPAAWRRGREDDHVSIPFIAGQWSLLAGVTPEHCVFGDVSIPFIAGQWSLRDSFRSGMH